MRLASRSSAMVLLLVLLVSLFVGTLMPGAWRDEAFRITHLPWQLTKVAHFVLFACVAAVARLPPLALPVWMICLSTLVLALLTEGLQYLASNRNPSWQDLVIDMAGAALGLLLAGLAASRASPINGEAEVQ